MAVKEIDAKGMQCPGPIVEVFKAMKVAQPGDIFNIQASDQGFIEDIKTWCKKTGNELVSLEEGQTIKATIKKV